MQICRYIYAIYTYFYTYIRSYIWLWRHDPGDEFIERKWRKAVEDGNPHRVVIQTCAFQSGSSLGVLAGSGVDEWVWAYLQQFIHLLVLESQHPHKIVNLIGSKEVTISYERGTPARAEEGGTSWRGVQSAPGS